jgi:hypothetical protein
VHFTSTCNAEGIGGITVAYTKRNVTKKLLIESRTKVTRGYKLTFLTCEGRIVYREGHFHSRLAYLNELKGLNLCRRANCITDSDILASGEANDVTNLCLGYRYALKAIELIDGNDLGGARLSVTMEVTNRNTLSLLNNATLNTSDTYTTNELIIVDGRNEKLKRILFLTLGRRHVLKNSVEKGLKICARIIWIE